MEMGDEEEKQKLEEKMKQFDDDMTTYGSMDAAVEDTHKARKRNIIFDEERFEETFLKCMICRECFDEDEKLPKMLPCHHTFCLDCLQQMFRVEGEYRQSLTSAFRSMPLAVKICCPTCREGLICSEVDIKRLPNDTTILELLCYIKKTGKTDVQYCSKHKMQPLNFFCEPCIMPVCCDCTILDHKEKTGHIVMNVDEALGKYSPVLDETLTEMDKEIKVVEEKKQALEKAAENIEQIQKELAMQIRQTFDRMRDAIDERERELYNLSEHEIDKKRNEIGDQLAIVHDRDSHLKKDRTNLQGAKDSKDISSMFTHHQSARESLASKIEMPGPSRSTKDFAVSFQFNSRAENNIRSNISVFGDVSFK